jgi:peptidoglycan LD-endopeptidase CwlK
VRLLSDKCLANGIELRVTQGLRTWNQQDLLYAQGRTDPGKIVTEAPGGYSGHNFGYCADIVPADENFPVFTPDWDAMDSRWKQVLTMAKGANLAEGAEWRTFPDRPHLYLEELPSTPTNEMRYIYKEGGMPAVWNHFADTYDVKEE